MKLTNTPAKTHREDQTSGRKSLRVVTGGSADFSELAKDCVCFANGAGGRIFVGIEDGDMLPPPGQRIDLGLMDRVRRRIGSEISGRAIKRALDQLIADAQVEGVGDRRWRNYRLAPAINHPGPEGR